MLTLFRKWWMPLSVLFCCLATPGAAQVANSSSQGRVLYTSNASGSWQIYSIRPDGSHAEQLTNLPATTLEGWGPTYSPDGRKIAFVYGPVDQNGNGPVDAYVMDADGGNLTQVTHDGSCFIVRWAPDGKHFVITHGSDAGVGIIEVMRTDGTHLHALTSKVWDSFGAMYTPDGKHIVYYSQEGGYVAAVWVMNADGSKKRRLTAAELEGAPWDVSPDGRRIAFASHINVALPNSIYTIGIDGGNLRRLTSMKAAHDVDPTYSPDGTHIAFASDRRSSDASLDLYVMRTDGSGVHRIASGLTIGGCPDGNCVTPDWGGEE